LPESLAMQRTKTRYDGYPSSVDVADHPQSPILSTSGVPTSSFAGINLTKL